MEGKSEIVEVKTFPFPAGFNWAVGPAMQKFIQALAGKRVLGAKCPSCGYTYVPPRSRCGKCYTAMGEKNMVDLSGRGTLMSYTKAHVRMDGQSRCLHRAAGDADGYPAVAAESWHRPGGRGP